MRERSGPSAPPRPLTRWQLEAGRSERGPFRPIGDIAGCRIVRRRTERMEIRDRRAKLLVGRIARRHLGTADAASNRLEDPIVSRAVREDDRQVGTVHAFRVDAVAVGAPRLEQSSANQPRRRPQAPCAMRQQRRPAKTATTHASIPGICGALTAAIIR